MRVAHFVQRYPPALGGSEAYFARLGRFLAVAGDPVTVFTTNALDLEAFWSTRATSLPESVSEEDGVEVRRYGLWRFRGRRYLLKALSLIPHPPWQRLTLPCNPISWQMWKDAGRSDLHFDLVHATAFPYAWPIACGLRLARRFDIPFLVTPFLHLGDPNDPRDPSKRSYLRPSLLSLLHAADRIFVQTITEKKALLDCGIREDRLFLLGMGVEPEECTGGNRVEARRMWGLDETDKVIGHLANNSFEKGTIDLLKAASILWAKGHQFRVVIAGPEMANFRRFWEEFKWCERVKQLGILDDQQKRDFFAAIDVFALPSRSDSFGLVLLEAWSNGVPNIAYRAGGVADVIRDSEDGLLVPCGDIEGLAEAFIHLIEDKAWREQLGNAGKSRTQTEFRWEKKLQQVRGVYQEESQRGAKKKSRGD